MATLNKKILAAALKQNLIRTNLDPDLEKCLRSSIIQIIKILRIIEARGENGASLNQLQSQMRISKNTIAIYARWLKENKFLKSEIESNSSGNIVIYYLEL